MPNNLNQVTDASSEDKKIACMGIALQRFLDLEGQTIYGHAAGQFAHRQLDTHACGKGNHCRTSAVSTATANFGGVKVGM